MLPGLQTLYTVFSPGVDTIRPRWPGQPPLIVDYPQSKKQLQECDFIAAVSCRMFGYFQP